MLRIKRSVQAQFSTQVNFVSVQMLAAAAGQEATSKTGKLFYQLLYVVICKVKVKVESETTMCILKSQCCVFIA